MRAGIIGYGLAGRYFHAPNLLGAGFEIAAVCARSLERKGQVHDDFPGAVVVNSVEELVAENLDLVVVASTNDVHATHARMALDAGIPTVVDKPMGRDYYETAEIFDLSESRGVPVTVFFNRLWDSDTLTIKKALSTGELGEVIRYESRFERYRPVLNPGAWRENVDPESGGGLLLDLQTHLVAIALHLFGPAQLSHASIKSVRGGADDDVVLTLKHESGVDSYLAASAVIGSPGPRVRLNTTEGTLIFSQLDKQEDLLRKGYRPIGGEWSDATAVTSEARVIAGEKSFGYPALPGNYAAFYSVVKDALLAGQSMPVTRSQALAVAEILDQARRIG